MTTAKAMALAVALLLAGAARAQEVEVAKADWFAAMRTALPTMFCAEGFYFRACFKVTAQQCEKLAAASARVCLDDLGPKIPARLKQPRDGLEWGRQVGECAGRSFELALLPKKIQSAKCNDPSAWTG